MKYYLITFIVIFFTTSGCTNKTEDRDIDLYISSSSASIGAVLPEQKDIYNQKLTYSIVMQNPDRISVVDNVDVILTKLLKDRVINIQSEGIQYDDKGTIIISGEAIFDARGLSKEEISQFDLLKSIQFIGDNNKEYFLPILH